MTDSQGTPLSVVVSEANEHDVAFLLPWVFEDLALGALPSRRGLPGRPRKDPRRVRADRGYASRDVLQVRGASGIEAEIPQRGSVAPIGLAKRRWPVERTISWLKQYRRVGTRRERKLARNQTFVTLACAMIAFKQFAW